jgi:hypothetical protein
MIVSPFDELIRSTMKQRSAGKASERIGSQQADDRRHIGSRRAAEDKRGAVHGFSRADHELEKGASGGKP